MRQIAFVSFSLVKLASNTGATMLGAEMIFHSFYDLTVAKPGQHEAFAKPAIPFYYTWLAYAAFLSNWVMLFSRSRSLYQGLSLTKAKQQWRSGLQQLSFCSVLLWLVVSLGFAVNSSIRAIEGMRVLLDEPIALALAAAVSFFISMFFYAPMLASGLGHFRRGQLQTKGKYFAKISVCWSLLSTAIYHVFFIKNFWQCYQLPALIWAQLVSGFLELLGTWWLGVQLFHGFFKPIANAPAKLKQQLLPQHVNQNQSTALLGQQSLLARLPDKASCENWLVIALGLPPVWLMFTMTAYDLLLTHTAILKSTTLAWLTVSLLGMLQTMVAAQYGSYTYPKMVQGYEWFKGNIRQSVRFNQAVTS